VKSTTFIFEPKIPGENFRSLLIVAGGDATPRQFLFLVVLYTHVTQQIAAAAVFPIAIGTANRESEEHNLYFRT
jgi:hypothetical protein